MGWTQAAIRTEITRAGYLPRAVALFLQEPSLDSDKIGDQLIAEGMQPYLARQLVVVLPEAFAQLLYEGFGIRTTPLFRMRKDNGKLTDFYHLAAVPTWPLAVAYARELRNSGLPWSKYQVLIERSARWGVIAAAGKDLPAEKLRGTKEKPMLFYGISIKDPNRKWWQIW
jgi:hypothetical protein